MVLLSRRPVFSFGAAILLAVFASCSDQPGSKKSGSIELEKEIREREAEYLQLQKEKQANEEELDELRKLIDRLVLENARWKDSEQ